LVKAAVFGLALAASLFTWVFRARDGRFWLRMPIAAGLLGLLALHSTPGRRRDSPGLIDVATGLLSASALYVIFQVGDRLARRIMPRGGRDIAAIYALRSTSPRWLIALLLAGIIAPCEELFWRGLLQEQFAKRFGTLRGTIAASLCYGLVHVGSRNLTLTGAAATAGAFWGMQYALQRRLPALIVSHVAWDLWIFLIAPTDRGNNRRLFSQ
jgi:membrane protease YdiL (CAAX protease family)